MSRQGDQVSKRPRSRRAVTRAVGHLAGLDGGRWTHSAGSVVTVSMKAPLGLVLMGRACVHTHTCVHVRTCLPVTHTSQEEGRFLPSPRTQPQTKTPSVPACEGVSGSGSLTVLGRSRLRACAQPGAGSPGQTPWGSHPLARRPACSCLCVQSSRSRPRPPAGEADRAWACSPAGSPCELHPLGPGNTS